MSSDNNVKETTTFIAAYNKIPYAMINAEVEGSTSDILKEFGEIADYYKIYKKGAKFATEGTGGHYVAANLKYKKAASLINKEARFLFGRVPDIKFAPQGDVGKVTQESKDMITTMQNMLNNILKENMFDSLLIKAVKDCLIAKRIAWLVNFNEEDGVTISFIPALNFIYETKETNPSILKKIVTFTIIKNKTNLEEKRIFKKKFELVDTVNEDGTHGDVCYLEEGLYDGRGVLIEQVTEYQPTLLKEIPAGVITNDGLTGETEGESEIEWLKDYESWFSKLSNSDIDTERRNMNPVKWTRDTDPQTTKNLSTSPGSYWDLTTDQNLDKANPGVGVLESSMSYSPSLTATLARIKAGMYEQVDMPDISLESMTNVVTSGKALKAIYWPLTVRCNEKMMTWGPHLARMVKTIITGAMAYPDTILKYTISLIAPVMYDVEVENNYPLPEDEQEEKTLDISEVTNQLMSRKSYMKKWRNLTDQEADEEIEQMAKEKSTLEESAFNSDESFEGVNNNQDDGMTDSTSEDLLQ